MSLIIGTNSYITVQEADAYIAGYFLDNDPLRIAWQSQSESNKEVYLRKACLQIETLPLRGVKKDKNQVLSFPRKDGGLEKAKLAQALQAASLTDAVAEEEISNRALLRRAGVKSYSIGNLSETFGDASGKDFGQVSSQVITILKSYISGGYKICI